MTATDEGIRNVEFAFGLIKSAAELLSVFPYQEAADSLRRQETAAWMFDPTTMLYHDRNDLERKLRLLDAAADFIREWDAVKAEALAAPEKWDTPDE